MSNESNQLALKTKLPIILQGLSKKIYDFYYIKLYSALNQH